MERGILLVNDLADVEASSLLMAGSQSGTSSLLITVNPKNHPVSGYLGVDNGGYSNSRYRYSALVNGANPLKQGDIFTASVLYTGHGQTGYSFTYGSPAFGQGQRYGISYGRSQYEIGGTFTGMGMQGDADTLSLSYQLNTLRSRMANNYVGLRYDYKWLRDNYGSFNWQGRKTPGAVVLETHGDWQDRSHLGLAQNNYSLSYTYGHMSHKDDITKAMADLGAMAPAGNFGKKLIQADGGLVVMAASGKDALIDSAVNNSGMIQANTPQGKAGQWLIDPVNITTGKNGVLNAGSIGADTVNITAHTIKQAEGVTVNPLTIKNLNLHQANPDKSIYIGNTASSPTGAESMAEASLFASGGVFSKVENLKLNAGEYQDIHLQDVDFQKANITASKDCLYLLITI